MVFCCNTILNVEVSLGKQHLQYLYVYTVYIQVYSIYALPYVAVIVQGELQLPGHSVTAAILGTDKAETYY